MLYDIHLLNAVDLKNEDGETVSVRIIEARQVRVGEFLECKPTNLKGCVFGATLAAWYAPYGDSTTYIIPASNVKLIDVYEND